jgi:hypothetical protein
MNDLIQKLVEQAGVPLSMPFDKWCEKFAELFVAETIAVLQKRFTGDLNREDMEVRRCIADVQKHFEVEP